MEELLKNAAKAVIELKSRLYMYGTDGSIEHIKSRVKSQDSISKKLQKRGKTVNVTNAKKYVRDIGGVRVSVLFVEDVYKVFAYIKSQKDFKITRVKDYIKNPKKSGYQSLHLNILVPVHTSIGKKMVEVELQIRTVGMDFFASVEHLLAYKREEDISSDVKNRLLKCSDMVTQLDKELFSIRDELMQQKST
jgi:putative GTP pyrophosphokinase